LVSELYIYQNARRNYKKNIKNVLRFVEFCFVESKQTTTWPHEILTTVSTELVATGKVHHRDISET